MATFGNEKEKEARTTPEFNVNGPIGLSLAGLVVILGIVHHALQALMGE